MSTGFKYNERIVLRALYALFHAFGTSTIGKGLDNKTTEDRLALLNSARGDFFELVGEHREQRFTKKEIKYILKKIEADLRTKTKEKEQLQTMLETVEKEIKELRADTSVWDHILYLRNINED